MQIVTRIATAYDKPTLFALYRDAMRVYIEKIWGWDESWQIGDFDKTFEITITKIIEANSEFAGYFQTEMGGHSDYLRMLIIKPHLRSAGIGRQVLEGIRKESNDKGKTIALRVFKLNSDALRFYLGNGWKVIDEENEFYLLEN